MISRIRRILALAVASSRPKNSMRNKANKMLNVMFYAASMILIAQVLGADCYFDKPPSLQVGGVSTFYAVVPNNEMLTSFISQTITSSNGCD